LLGALFLVGAEGHQSVYVSSPARVYNYQLCDVVLHEPARMMFLSARPLLDNLNSLGLRASRMGIDRADPIQRPNDAC
jgi:hypothetical protein